MWYNAWTWTIIGGIVGAVIGIVFRKFQKKTENPKPVSGGALNGAIVGVIVGLIAGLIISVQAPAGQAYESIPEIDSMNVFQRQVLASNRPVLVDFYATWCGPCHALAPRIGKLSEQYAGKVQFVKVDVDRAAKLAEAYTDGRIPTVVLFDAGRIAERWIGLRGIEDYQQKIDEVLEDSERKNDEGTKQSREIQRSTTDPAGTGTEGR